MPHIAFFGHNANDAAVRRRAIAFQRAGFEVTGFMPYRGAARDVEWPVIELGETQDNAYAQRILSIFSGARIAMGEADLLRRVDMIYARNLDMLAMAARVRRKLGLDAPLVYECLDIHHRLSGDGLPSRLLRRIEAGLVAQSALIVISSPRFETEHFAKYYPGAYRTCLVENRMIEGDLFPARPEASAAATLRPGKLRIGWFGNLRCRRSLDLMLLLAKRFPDTVEISLRGYAAPGVFEDFEGEVAPIPNIQFGGRYQAPQDLAEIYGDVDLVWAGDWYEKGANSLWLLPNRVYESGYFATPALAASGTETARWLSDHSGGILLSEPIEETLIAQVAALLEDPSPITDLRARLLEEPRATFVESTDFSKEIFEAASRGERPLNPT